MRSDRELLELAAKAAGYRIHAERQAERDACGEGDAGLWIIDGDICWNPLTDDGDALRLAVALPVSIDFSTGEISGASAYASFAVGDMEGARRAIVEFAADTFEVEEEQRKARSAKEPGHD